MKVCPSGLYLSVPLACGTGEGWRGKEQSLEHTAQLPRGESTEEGPGWFGAEQPFGPQTCTQEMNLKNDKADITERPLVGPQTSRTPLGDLMSGGRPRVSRWSGGTQRLTYMRPYWSELTGSHVSGRPEKRRKVGN